MNTLLVVDRAAHPGPYRDAESGLVLSFNGEIYNYRELAAAWGIQLSSQETDAHLLLRAWAMHGPRCLRALDGMFALALYDANTATLYLARDRLGEKPLYWRLDGDRLVFASEVSSLIGYGSAPPVLRPDVIAIETPAGADTPFQGIQLLAPATLLVFDVATTSTEQSVWWQLEALAPYEGDYEAALASFASALTEQLPLRVPSGDFALLLSGGLDSSVLAYLMRPPVCVTVRYPGRHGLDESAIAAEVARDVGAELVVVEPKQPDFVEALPHMLDALDYPMGNAATFSEYMAYAKIADLGVRVAVGGLGPDEFLMGYVRHLLTLAGPDIVADPSLHSYQPMAAKLLTDGYAVTDPTEIITRLILRGPDIRGRIHTVVARALERADGEITRALTLVELATAWRPLVLTSDKLASAFALERRSPYLAREIVELSYRLPMAYKVEGPTRGKRIMRDAARSLGLPTRLWDSSEKLGFASPVPTWLNGPLAAWADAEIRAALATAPTGWRPLLAGGLEQRSQYDRTRMLALMAATWLTNHTERTAA